MAGQRGTPRSTDFLANVTSSDNTAARATQAAVAGATHYVCGISASADEAAVFLATIEDDDTVVWRGFVHNQRDVVFDTPIAIARGNKVDLELAAAGSGKATNGTIWGFTE